MRVFNISTAKYVDGIPVERLGWIVMAESIEMAMAQWRIFRAAEGVDSMEMFVSVLDITGRYVGVVPPRTVGE